MSQNLAKRFYKEVSIASGADGFSVLLDGRALKTPGKQPLIIPREDQAQAVMSEWERVEEKINPSLMPCTRLLNVACEQTPIRRDKLVAEARNYVATDLLCYRAEAPQDLVTRQAKAWDPVLDWGEGLGIVLKTTSSILAIDQDAAALERMAELASDMEDVPLTLLVHFIATFGSALLGLAVMKTHIDVQTAFGLSRIDEDFQIEQWGEDEEAAQRTAFIKTESLALEVLI